MFLETTNSLGPPYLLPGVLLESITIVASKYLFYLQVYQAP